MLVHILALAIAMQKDSDAWELKPSVDPKTKLSWGMTVEAQAQGQDHHAAFKFSQLLKTSDDKKKVVTFSWDHLAVDDQEGQDVPAWDAAVGTRGEILKMEGDTEDSFRRMLSPLLFVYPEKPFAMGEKWSFEAKPSGSNPTFTYSYEAKKTEMVKDTMTVVLATKIVESGKDGMTGEGTWWLSRAGRVIKFEIKLKNWVVPMAGADAIDATLKGQAV